MSHVFVCLNLKEPINQNLIKLDFNDENISSITVDELKDKLSSTQPDLPSDYVLTFFGRSLKQNNKLSNYGIKTGAKLFLLAGHVKETDSQSTEKKPKFEQKELEKMLVAIRTALFNVKFRQMLNQLHDKDFRENLLAVVPALKDNIVAFNILLDPELMMICSEKDNVTKFSDKLSVFVEAATHLACAFHEEVATNQSNGNQSSNFGQNAYSLDASDDELEDARPAANQQVRETQPIIQNRFTTSMLQRALANSGVNTNAMPTSSTSNVNSPSTSSSGGNSLNIQPQINQNINSSLMQRNAAQSTAKNWSKELSTMKELGLSNDRISVQALEMTAGNIEQAVNLYWILLDDQPN